MPACRRLVVLLTVFLAPVLASAQIINTVAGGRAMDSGMALSTSLSPVGIVVDTGGNLFVSVSEHRVYKVTPVGNLVPFAGNGQAGFDGDNGPATSAQLNSPGGLAVDTIGNLYIADRQNHRVRKVASDGTITTFAGNGTAAFAGDGASATAASLNQPTGLSLDMNGNLLIADTNNNRIRSVTSMGVISTVASVNSPSNVTADTNGNFYIAASSDHRILKVSAGGQISSVVGIGVYGYAGDGGLATNAQIAQSTSVAVDANGILYIADTGNNRIRKVAADGTISTIAGTGSYGYAGDGGPAVIANFEYPSAISLDTNGNLYVIDTSDRVRKIAGDGSIGSVAGNGNGDGGLATRATLDGATDIAYVLGNLYIADRMAQAIRKVTPGGQISTVAGNGGPGFGGDGGPATQANISYPNGIAVDSMGNIYIADTNNNRIRMVNPAGTITTVAGNGLGTCETCGSGGGGPNGDGGSAINAKVYQPNNVAVDANGNLYIAQEYNSRIRKVTPDGIISTYVGGGSGYSDGVPATSIDFYGPQGIAIDAAGNLFIAMGSVIRKVTADGIINTIAGNGVYGFSGDGGPALSANINYPRKLVVDAIGNLYFSSGGSARVRKVTPAGIISTVAGTGVSAFSGDGGLATSADLIFPDGVTVDADGNLLFSDGGERIRKVTFPFSLVRIVSRKTHGAASIFELPLDPNPLINGRVSVEPRNLGAGHMVAFRFNEPVTSAGTISVVDSASTPIGNVTSPTFNGKELILGLKDIPDNRRVKISIAGVNGALDVSTSMAFLVGDFNGTGLVSASDISAIKTRLGQPTTARNFRFDIGASGSVEAINLSAVKARSGTVLP